MTAHHIGDEVVLDLTAEKNLTAPLTLKQEEQLQGVLHVSQVQQGAVDEWLSFEEIQGPFFNADRFLDCE